MKSASNLILFLILLSFNIVPQLQNSLDHMHVPTNNII